MPTIDLTSAEPRPASPGVLDALPRRVALTLPELELVAELAGGAPLPFDRADPTAEPSPTSGLAGRLGATRESREDQGYREALASLRDPAVSLTRRGLASARADGPPVLDDGLAGAVGLLATPRLALEIDIAVGAVRVKAWHRQSGDAVASLATADGIVFELAWYPAETWPEELARVAVLPEELTRRTSQVPAVLDLPYQLADASVEAAASARPDLLHLLVGQHSGAVLADGETLSDAETNTVLAALGTEAQGRLRVLVAEVTAARTAVVGVRSWLLLADGWRSVHPHDDGARVLLSAVEPGDLAADLAPVLAEVTAR